MLLKKRNFYFLQFHYYHYNLIVIQDLGSTSVDGLILTGWSRFDHRAPLCELLPTSLPSLVYNLVYLRNVTASREEVEKATRVRWFFFHSLGIFLTIQVVGGELFQF